MLPIIDPDNLTHPEECQKLSDAIQTYGFFYLKFPEERITQLFQASKKFFALPSAEKEKIALSRRVDKHWRLIGWGEINRGVTIEPTRA